MHSILFRKKQVTFYRSGEEHGTPVVLLHGFCEDSSVWQEWLDLLPHRRFIRIDLPGSGYSELHGNLTIESMADTVIAVMDHLGVGEFHLVGHSMGGYVSLALAEKHPQRLSSLCMFHSHVYADPEDKKAGRLKSIEFIKNHGHLLFVRQMIPNLFAQDFYREFAMTVKNHIRNAAQTAPEAIMADLEAMRIRPDRSEVLKNIACPVLFIIGKLDAAIPLDFSYSQAHLPNVADIQLFPKVGHMGMLEAPRETAKVFREFLSSFEKTKK